MTAINQLAALPTGSGELAPPPPSDATRAMAAARRRHRIIVHTCQLLVLLVFLAAWQWIPTIPGASTTAPWLNRFFISSPEAVGKEIWYLATATHNVPSIWSALGSTLETTLIGAISAIIIGGLCGLLLGNYRTLSEIFSAYITALNAVPRVALIPVIVLVASSSSDADAITAFTVCFFLVFFSAFEGARGVSYEMTEMMRIFGAKRLGIMLRVRAPYSGAWIFVNLPNIVSHALVGVVTAELFTGGTGIGNLLVTAVDTADASLTFGIVIYLAISGLVLILLAGLLRKRLLAWWDEASGAGRAT